MTVCRGCGADLRAYALALTFADVCFNRGLDFALAGDSVAAQREFCACLALRPGDEEAWLVYGKARWASGDRSEARQIWERLQSTTSDARVKQQAAKCLETEPAEPEARKAAPKSSRKSTRKSPRKRKGKKKRR